MQVEGTSKQIPRIALTCVLLLCACACCRAFAQPPDEHTADRVGAANIAPEARREIVRAGNAGSEKERYRILSVVRTRADLPPELRREIDAILPAIDWWANGRDKAAAGAPVPMNRYLPGFFNGIALNDNWPGAMAPDSPLYPLWAFYRARALIWETIEYGRIWSVPENRKRWFDQARRLFKIANEAFPDNPIIAMYNGKALPWPAAFAPDPQAPDWANLQREGIEKLADVIHWWIDERQLADGQYGGGWDDDVEMWRWWTPILVAFEDPKVATAQARLSKAILSQPYMKKGYTSHMQDVEHSSEDTFDAITPMLFLDPDHAEWRDRTLRIVELARTIWMGENERGFLQFKSTYFNVERVDADLKRACDSVYHARVFLPALLHWQRTGDRQVGDMVTRWMDTWVDAAARAENGKPTGIVPSVIHWPDGEVGGGVEPWWKPQNYGEPLYEWPSAMSQLVNTLLLTYHMTGNATYLEPIRSMAAIRLNYLKDPPTGVPEPGGEAWCASQMAGFLRGVLSKYRLLTADPAFDELLAAEAGGYLKMRMGGGIEALVADLEANAKAFRINNPGYTSEVRWTDRVLTFNPRWGQIGNGWDWPAPQPTVLYASATGDPGDPLYFPMNAVRWLTEPRAFAALVTDSGPDRFAAEVYHFGDAPRKMAAELYLLKPGEYRMTMTVDGEAADPPAIVTVAGPRTRIAFALAPRALCRIRVEGGDQ